MTNDLAAQQVRSPPIGDGLAREVVEAKRLASVLTAAANKVDSDFAIGTMFNEVDLSEHTCYALGVLLGFEASVRHLRFNRTPRLVARNSDEAHDLRVNSQSLANFTGAVAGSLKMSAGQRASAWNLDCAGQYGISPSTSAPTAPAAFFEVTRDGKGIRILGDIESGFALKLQTALAQNPNAEFVALGSGGGSVGEAVGAGRLIRSKKLTTVIWNNCYSACPLVFFGGVVRNVHSPYPGFGFHQLSIARKAIPIDSPLYTALAGYIREMGIDDRYVLDAMRRASPTEMNMVFGTDVDLCRARVATWIQRVCEAGR